MSIQNDILIQDFILPMPIKHLKCRLYNYLDQNIAKTIDNDQSSLDNFGISPRMFKYNQITKQHVSILSVCKTMVKVSRVQK